MSSPSEIRAWCVERGLASPGRGRLSAACREAHAAANGDSASSGVDSTPEVTPQVRSEVPARPVVADPEKRRGMSTLEQIKVTPSPQASGIQVAVPCKHGPGGTSLMPDGLTVPPGSAVTWPTCKDSRGGMRMHYT